MNSYIIKVTEKHSDTVTVEASNEDDAIKKALDVSYCEYESLYDAEVISEQPLNDQ